MSFFEGWDDQTVGEPSILNVCTVPSNTGAELINYDRSKYKLLICTATGGGLLVNHVYLCPINPADPLIDISDVGTHSHTDNTSGGSMFEILRGNPKLMDTGAMFVINPAKEDWGQTIGAGGSLTNDTDGTTKEKSIKGATGATNGTVVDKYLTALKADFAKRMMFQTAIKLGTASNLALAGGINADSLSISATNTQKINYEICSTNNMNIWVRSADGTLPAAEDTGIAPGTTKTAIKAEHFPDLSPKKIDWYIGNNAVWQKTTRIPNTGVTAADNLYKTSIKLNTGAADRTYFEYGVRIRYEISDTWN